jgi:hypothetical protein
MTHPKVSKCANPQCHNKFKRLGEGRLYLHPPMKESRTRQMSAAWLCSQCVRSHTMRFDATHHSFVLVRTERAA